MFYVTTITPELRSKIERRSNRAWRRLHDGAPKSLSRISDVTKLTLLYRLPYTPDYYGKEKIRVVKHKDGWIEVDPKTTGLIDCKTKDDLDRLEKHGDTVRAYIVTNQDAKSSGKVLKIGKGYKTKDNARLQSRAQCLESANPGDRVFVVELHADDIEKSGYGYFEVKSFSVTDELDKETDLGFTVGLIDCQTKADIDKLKKHIGEVRAYVLKKREKRALPLNKKHTLKTGERYASRAEVVDAVRPGDKVYVAEFSYSDIDKHHTDGVSATAKLVEVLDPVKDLGFIVGSMLDMIKNSDFKKLAKHVGMVRGYKYVTEDLKSPTQTGNARITYKVGEEFEILNADTDPHNTCAAGINIATQEWCKGFAQPPKRALAFEFHSKDIAAIPTDGGKMRVFRCLCVEEVDIKTFAPLNPRPPAAPTETLPGDQAQLGSTAPKKSEPKKRGFWDKLMGRGAED